MELLVLGDNHNRDLFSVGRKQPFQLAIKEFYNWFCASEYNDPKYDLLFLGDLTEKSVNQGELNDFFVDLFVNRLKSNRIMILQGNHDCSREGSNLSTFRSIPKVSIIDEPTVMEYGKLTFAFLPHLPKNYKDKSMKAFYENPTEEFLTTEFDYAFGHLMDETRSFGKNKGIDLSKYKIKQRVFGHDHNFNLDSGGSYLGSISPNSLAENGQKKYIYRIDCTTGDGVAIEVPVFLGYQEVEYPNPLPEETNKYTIWTVKNALDKGQAIEFYRKECVDKGQDFFYRRIEKKKTKSEEEIEARKSNKGQSTIPEYLSNYKEKVELEDTVYTIVESIVCQNDTVFEEGGE